jgi:hypothetical protein
VSHRLLASAACLLALAGGAGRSWADKLCSDRPYAIGMLVEEMVTGSSFEGRGEHVRRYCPPQRADARTYLQVLETRPAAIITLDTVDDGLFAVVREEWRKAPPSTEALVTYLSIAKNARRFAAIVELVGRNAQRTVIVALVSSTKKELLAQRVAWVQATLAAIDDPAQLEPLARDLFVLELTGRIQGDGYKDLLAKLRERAPKALTATRWAVADQKNPVLDVARLAAAGVDAEAFLAFVRDGALASCSPYGTRLLACARTIAKSEVPKLPALVATALKPEFEKSFQGSQFEVGIANELASLGWNLEFIGDRLCKEARGQLRRSRERALETAKQYTSAAACARSLEAELDTERLVRNLLGMLGLILPLLLGGALLRRWWRHPPRPEGFETDGASAAIHRDARLDTFLGRGLATGVELARRDLALGALGPGVIERATATVKRAITTGAAASLLVRDGETTAYIVALPVRHAQPQLVERYLGAAWPEHVRRVQDLAGSAVSVLVILCGPDAAEATLLVGRHDGAQFSDPDVLLGAREARERGANSFHHIIPLTA